MDEQQQATGRVDVAVVLVVVVIVRPPRRAKEKGRKRERKYIAVT